MRAYQWNEGWYFKHLEEKGAGMAVTLPHDAMIYEPRTENALGGKNVGWFEGRDYLYTKSFYVPPEAADDVIILEFEGVYHNADVWINGTKAAFRPYGYSNFYVQASSYIKYDAENKIEVIARNSDQPNSRWYSGAGIYRPVTLWTAKKKHIPVNGVKIKTLSINPPVIEVSAATVGEGRVLAEICDGSKVIASAFGNSRSDADGNACQVFQIEIPGGQCWEVESPVLYTCRVTFEEDICETTFGIRTLDWGEEGLLLNGKRVILRGACIHHDHGPLGAAAYADAEERRVDILKQNGYNAIRSAHNPCSKALLDACDRQGMLVMDELVDCWYIHKTEYDYVNWFDEWWQQDLADMVDKDYNHPCVIMYSTGNEVSETAQKRGIELTGKMTRYLHQLDASRPVTCGVNIFFNFLSSVGFGVYSDKKSEAEVRQAEKRKQSGKKKKAVGSEFFNNLAGLLGDNAMKIGATLPPCDWKTKDAFANMDIAGYNYGIYRYRHDLKKYPKRLILGSETFCKDAAAFYELAKKEKRIIGDFVWAGMDYLGEVGVGAWEYKDYAPDFGHGPGWITAGSGRIDITGNPLAEASYTKTVFGLIDYPVIAVRPVNHSKDKHSPSAWKMTDARESWSWNGCEGKDAEVEVYSSADSAELFINGISQGRRKLKHCRTRFKVKYQSGCIEAAAYDTDGKECGRHRLESASESTQLQLIPEKREIKKNGLVFVHIKYTDEKNIVKVLERGDISVAVKGGKLLALGNGCPFNATGYVSNHTDTWFGQALAIIQIQGEHLYIEASDGIHSASVRIERKEYGKEHNS